MVLGKCWPHRHQKIKTRKLPRRGNCGRNQLNFLLAVLLLVGELGVACAEQTTIPGRKTLRTFLNEVTNYTAQFEQALYDEYGELIEESSGTVALAKPGKFRWEYLQPYSQQIISNGEFLWIYDQDLLQVSINKIARGNEQSPLALLVSGADLEQSYVVESISRNDELRWLALTPKLAESEYQRVEIGVTETEVVRMRLHDNLNQVTELTFIEANKLAEVDAAIFEFVIPPGIDVVNGLTE